MLELSIHFTSDEKDETSPIHVHLFNLDAGTRTDPAPFEPPLGEKELDDLRWYLEVFSTWPTGPDYEKAERIESRFEDWGRALLASVTPDRESARLWQQFSDADGDGKLVTVDAVDPRVLRLPWELLADEAGHLFAQGIGVRRRLKKATSKPLPPFALPVRILVVVSRPEGAGFIDPRAVSRPLLDALDRLGSRVDVEFLYPPTLKALTDRLRDRQAPPVHVVHFDGHGVYDAALGLGYLLFEDDKHGQDRVDATRLGTLVSGRGVPLMVLNACQSAAQDEGNPYASVAARLIQAGVGSALAMNYSVLVEAARRFVASFYGGLAQGLTVGQAVDEGRTELLADEKRHTLTRRNAEGDTVEETIRLRDWFLPALYQQAQDPKVFDPDQSAGLPIRRVPAALTDPTVPGGLPASPPHGFHGRAREMLHLERALADKRVVVLHGFGGLGKTALASEAGRWFHRTGRFPGGAAFVSFEHGGSLQQLCSWVGQAVSGDPDWTVHGEGDPVERAGALLRERPALVILDNFESVLGREPLMPAEELAAVLDAAWGWAGSGGTRVLVTTRDTTFSDHRFKPSRECAHVELGGLEREEALALAGAVLDDHGVDRAGIGREALVGLMERLGGHPLSLNLVLPHLRHYTPDQLMERFEELLPGFTEGKARERNESLAVSLEFSLRRLGDETRAALPDLAVFQGGCMEGQMLTITEMDPHAWEEARAELAQAALVTLDTAVALTTRLPGGMQYDSHFVTFHPTLAPYLATRLSAERRQTLEARYWETYYHLASDLYRLDTQHPVETRAIALRELPNLRRALDLAIEAGAVAEAVDFADSIARFLYVFGRWREREAMMRGIEILDIRDERGLTKAEWIKVSQKGNALLQQGRAAEAEQVFRALLQKMEAGMAYGGDGAAHDFALMSFGLGRCLAAQGRPGEAVGWHRRALAGFERLSGADQSAKRMLGRVYTDLGDNLAEVGRFDEAQQAYESGLVVSREIDDHRSVGVKLAQLGSLALRRGEMGEARRRYVEALETFRALGEPQSEAAVWHMLGRIEEEARDWEQAEYYHREGLKIDERINDLESMAKAFNQLAMVAEGAGRLEDAERWYLRAIELGEQLRYDAELGKCLNNLAGLYLAQGRLDEAEEYARRAVAIKETLDLSAAPWKTYSILARIAEARGRGEEAAGWRRKEQESYAAYAGAAHQMRQYEPLIQAIVAACRGDEAARRQVEASLSHMAGVDDVNRRFAQAAGRVLAGERDEEELTGDLERIGGGMVRAILRRLAGTDAHESEGDTHTPPPAPTSLESTSPSSGISPELARLLQQWAPVIGAVAAACGGDEEAAAQVNGLLDQLDGQDDWRALAGALRRVLAGEREPAALAAGLDATDRAILGAVLAALDEGGEGPEPEGRGVTVEQLIDLVGQAAGPDAPPGLGEQLYGLTRQAMADPGAPDEVRALMRALHRVLSGERDVDLAGVPEGWAAAVRAMVAGLADRGG